MGGACRRDWDDETDEWTVARVAGATRRAPFDQMLAADLRYDPWSASRFARRHPVRPKLPNSQNGSVRRSPDPGPRNCRVHALVVVLEELGALRFEPREKARRIAERWRDGAAL